MKRLTGIPEWLFAGSMAAAVGGYLYWLYLERQDAKVRMADHQYFMDIFKTSQMERGIDL